MVILMDPLEDPDDILRANRSREKTYMFDVAFDYLASQVGPESPRGPVKTGPVSLYDLLIQASFSVQEEVYRATTRGLIEGLISGYNATVFAYGPTGLDTHTHPHTHLRKHV